jgi:hypothetical protein
MTFNNTPPPWAATAFTSVLWSFSGVLNVILYTLTRPKLLPSRETQGLMIGSVPEWQKPTASGYRPGGHFRNESQVQVDSWDELSRGPAEMPRMNQVLDIAPLPPLGKAAQFKPSRPISFLAV